MDWYTNCVCTARMGLASAYGMRTGRMGGLKKAKILRTYYVHSPILYKQCERIEARQNAFGVKLQQLDAKLFILVFAKCATE